MTYPILVTGSSGFIGTTLVQKLCDLRATVIGCDRKPPQYMHEQFTHYTVDFVKPDQLAALFQRWQFSSCYHLGAIADINYARKHLAETVEINVTGTANVVHFCQEYSVPLNYMSTCCVYGNTPEHPSTEEALTKPTEIYGCTKLAGELILQGYFQLRGMRHNIIRSSTVYGPGMRQALATYIFLDRAKRNKPLPIHGTGEQTRTFTYIDDLIDGMALLHDKFFCVPINFAGNETVSVLDLADQCISLTQSRSHLIFEADRPGQVMREEIDISRAKKLLNWLPKTSLEQGILKTIAKWA